MLFTARTKLKSSEKLSYRNHSNYMSCIYVTRGFHGYSVQFSPYEANILACACSQHYGIAGCGALFIVDLSKQHQQGGMQLFRKLDWQEGLFDCCWSEASPSIIASSSADGKIQLWDIYKQQVPLTVFHEHSKEVYSIDWCTVRGNNKLLSGSWDKTVKLWDMNSTQNFSTATFVGHQNTVYCVKWSPHISDTFASTSGDETIRIWNTNTPNPVQVIPGGSAEILTCDWTKYDQNILISGSTNNQIRVWDLRNTQQPIHILNGHHYAVRRLKCSPHYQSMLASVSYDTTVRTWDYMKSDSPQETIQHHTEFVVGLDFNLHQPSETVHGMNESMSIPQSLYDLCKCSLPVLSWDNQATAQSGHKVTIYESDEVESSSQNRVLKADMPTFGVRKEGDEILMAFPAF